RLRRCAAAVRRSGYLRSRGTCCSRPGRAAATSLALSFIGCCGPVESVSTDDVPSASDVVQTTPISVMEEVIIRVSIADRIGSMVSLGQLWARSELALDVIVDPPTARDQEVTIVHSSELPEVDEWLAGGEVLLTIGVGQDLGAETVGD